MKCAICNGSLGEEGTEEFQREVEFGNIAEMYYPPTDDHGIVHTSCGVNAKWEVA